MLLRDGIGGHEADVVPVAGMKTSGISESDEKLHGERTAKNPLAKRGRGGFGSSTWYGAGAADRPYRRRSAANRLTSSALRRPWQPLLLLQQALPPLPRREQQLWPPLAGAAAPAPAPAAGLGAVAAAAAAAGAGAASTAAIGGDDRRDGEIAIGDRRPAAFRQSDGGDMHRLCHIDLAQIDSDRIRNGIGRHAHFDDVAHDVERAALLEAGGDILIDGLNWHIDAQRRAGLETQKVNVERQVPGAAIEPTVVRDYALLSAADVDLSRSSSENVRRR